jgi:ornithine cyclodeaminase
MEASKKQEIPDIYTLDQIERAIITPSFAKDLIHGIEEGFVALEKGEFFACPIQTMGTPPFPFVNTQGYAAQTCVKSGYFKGQEYYVIKVASGGHPMPNSGLMQVYSQKTGKLKAMLLDNGFLTEIRTAAVGSLACKLLGPSSIEKIGILGTGIQARYQLRMLPTVTDCRTVLVWGRTPSRSQELCDELLAEGWDVQVADQADDLLKECDLIVTTTCSREPLLGKDLSVLLNRRKAGLHISCIGSDAPGKMELTPELVAQADFLVADTVVQSFERGEFQVAVRKGLVESDSITSLGSLIESKHLHRQGDGDTRVTIFDSSGVAMQDCVVAQMTFEALNQP